MYWKVALCSIVGTWIVPLAVLRAFFPKVRRKFRVIAITLLIETVGNLLLIFADLKIYSPTFLLIIGNNNTGLSSRDLVLSIGMILLSVGILIAPFFKDLSRIYRYERESIA